MNQRYDPSGDPTKTQPFVLAAADPRNPSDRPVVDRGKVIESLIVVVLTSILSIAGSTWLTSHELASSVPKLEKTVTDFTQRAQADREQQAILNVRLQADQVLGTASLRATIDQQAQTNQQVDRRITRLEDQDRRAK